jgi:hypothetical protein
LLWNECALQQSNLSAFFSDRRGTYTYQLFKHQLRLYIRRESRYQIFKRRTSTWFAREC